MLGCSSERRDQGVAESMTKAHTFPNDRSTPDPRERSSAITTRIPFGPRSELCPLTKVNHWRARCGRQNRPTLGIGRGACAVSRPGQAMTTGLRAVLALKGCGQSSTGQSKPESRRPAVNAALRRRSGGGIDRLAGSPWLIEW